MIDARVKPAHDEWDVPPVADTLPSFAIPFWTAILAPASTPKDIVERIAAETNKAMRVASDRISVA